MLRCKIVKLSKNNMLFENKTAKTVDKTVWCQKANVLSKSQCVELISVKANCKSNLTFLLSLISFIIVKISFLIDVDWGLIISSATDWINCLGLNYLMKI